MQKILTLNESDPTVIAARTAEQSLFSYYGLQAKDHYVLLPDQGIKVRVSEFGSGEPVVIVPGNTGDVFPLASLLTQLSGKRILAINRPGGGLSEGMDHNTVNLRQFAVNSLETVLDAFRLENVDIVAHSMGAHWSLWFAMDRPKRVRNLVMLGNPGNVMGGKPPLRMRLIAIRPFSKLFLNMLLPKDKSHALDTLKMSGHTEEVLRRQPQAFAEAYYLFRHLPHYAISQTSLMENPAPLIDAQQLSQVKQPTALVLGTKDTFASEATGRKITEALPRGEFFPIKDAGHLPWLDDPAECGRLILAFLARNHS